MQMQSRRNAPVPSVACPRTACNGPRLKSGKGRTGQGRTCKTGGARSGGGHPGATGQRGTDEIKVVGPRRRESSAQSFMPETCQAHDAKEFPGEGLEKQLLAGVSGVQKHVCWKHVKLTTRKVARRRVPRAPGRLERGAEARLPETCQADDANSCKERGNYQSKGWSQESAKPQKKRGR